MGRKKVTKGTKLVEQKQASPKKTKTKSTRSVTRDSRPDAQTLPGRNKES